MKSNIFLGLIGFLFCVSAVAQLPNAKEKAIKIAMANTKNLTGVEQLLIVYTEDTGSRKANFVAVEKKENKWVVIMDPVLASIGRNGFAKNGKKKEGDGKTPTGIFGLGRLFSYEASLNTRLAFKQVDANDKWIDDPKSDDYNTYVRGNTSASSFEHLLLNSIDYKYCMVIEYNTHPIKKGKGSAIFFHLADENYTPTSGCVAIHEIDMLPVLNWLDPYKKKAILLAGVNSL